MQPDLVCVGGHMSLSPAVLMSPMSQAPVPPADLPQFDARVGQMPRNTDGPQGQGARSSAGLPQAPSLGGRLEGS